MTSVAFALYTAAGLVIGLSVRESVRGTAALRLGDPTPKQYGWISLNPRPKFDPFGTGLLPGLILVLIASGSSLLPPFAYAKPLPLDPARLRKGEKDVTKVALAGPATNLALAAIAGLALRVLPSGPAALAAFAFLYSNLSLCVIHLMPVPGLDGAKILGRFLAPRAAETYRNLDAYLPLFMLVVFFLLGFLFLGIVQSLVGGLCRVLAGAANCP